jgi:hypothetical protein
MSDHKTITDYISEKTNPYNASGLPLPPPPHQAPVATLRDQFAMAALTGLLADFETDEDPAILCDAAWNYADLMMEQRK